MGYLSDLDAPLYKDHLPAKTATLGALSGRYRQVLLYCIACSVYRYTDYFLASFSGGSKQGYLGNEYWYTGLEEPLHGAGRTMALPLLYQTP